MRPEFTLRIGTQDPVAFKEVLLDNCYRLPKSFQCDDMIVDVGGNIGCFAVACLARGCGPLTLVEPQPQNFALARRNTAAWGGQVTHHQFAVWWRAKGWVPIVDRGPQTAMHYVGRVDDGSLGLSVRRVMLDDLLPEIGVRLLKLDAEGGEYPALMEARRLKLVEEVVVECHPVEIDGRRFTYKDAAAQLENEGFEITGVQHEPSADQFAGNTVIWGRNKKR
jgi:FkbM family methyltransferase